jgi:hypothetical protein
MEKRLQQTTTGCVDLISPYCTHTHTHPAAAEMKSAISHAPFQNAKLKNHSKVACTMIDSMQDENDTSDTPQRATGADRSDAERKEKTTFAGGA